MLDSVIKVVNKLYVYKISIQCRRLDFIHRVFQLLILDYFLDGSNQENISHLHCKSNINIVLCFSCLNELQVYTWIRNL